jgi:hypothetical protein
MTAPDPIIAHNLDGDEVTLVVIGRAGLICISGSDGSELILAPGAGLELAYAIVELVIQHQRGEAGPISSTY